MDRSRLAVGCPGMTATGRLDLHLRHEILRGYAFAIITKEMAALSFKISWIGLNRDCDRKRARIRDFRGCLCVG